MKDLVYEMLDAANFWRTRPGWFWGWGWGLVGGRGGRVGFWTRYICTVYIVEFWPGWGGRFLDQILHDKFFNFFGGAGKKIYHEKSGFKNRKNLVMKKNFVDRKKICWRKKFWLIEKILSTEKKFCWSKKKIVVVEKNFGSSKKSCCSKKKLFRIFEKSWGPKKSCRGCRKFWRCRGGPKFCSGGPPKTGFCTS